MRYCAGAFLGAVVAFALVVLAGAVLFGLSPPRLGPGGGTVRPGPSWDAAKLGVLVFGVYMGLPAALGGAVLGALSVFVAKPLGRLLNTPVSPGRGAKPPSLPATGPAEGPDAATLLRASESLEREAGELLLGQPDGTKADRRIRKPQEKIKRPKPDASGG